MVVNLNSSLAKELNLNESYGIVVKDVKKNSRASKEIAIGDIILKVGRNVVNSVSDYRLMIKEYEKGDSILLLIKRNGASRFVALDL